MKEVGLIGFPVAHSLSPRMQQAAFAAAGIAARYSLWETPATALPERIAALRLPEILGANVTIPHKTAALSFIDRCDPLASKVGAINTIVNHDGRLTGYNTDVHGFIRALAESAGYLFEMEIPQKRAIIAGTGGAARAAAIGLLERGFAEITLLGRNVAHTQELQQYLQKLAAIEAMPVTIHARQFGDNDISSLLSRTHLLVNATPVGLHENDARLPLEVEALPTTAAVMDMIFNPPETPLLRAAQAHGCQILNGLSMLLYQGALAFECWTGLPAPIAAMRKALHES
jgi:shikimate dehydrogenase